MDLTLQQDQNKHETVYPSPQSREEEQNQIKVFLLSLGFQKTVNIQADRAGIKKTSPPYPRIVSWFLLFKITSSLPLARLFSIRAVPIFQVGGGEIKRRNYKKYEKFHNQLITTFLYRA